MILLSMILQILRRGSASRKTTGGRCSVSAHICGEAAIIRDAAARLKLRRRRSTALHLERLAGAPPRALAGWFEKLRGESVEGRERVERDV